MSSSSLTADVKLLFMLIVQRSEELFSQAYIWAQSKPVSRFLGNVRGLQTFGITLQIRRLCHVLAQAQSAVFLISTQISFLQDEVGSGTISEGKKCYSFGV